MNLGTIALVISLLVALFGAGMLTKIFNLHAENAVRADRQQRTEDLVARIKTEIREQAMKIALLEQSVQSVLARLSKLDLIDVIASDVRFTRESIAVINSQLIPRREVEAVIENLERRVDTLEHITK